MSDGDQMTYVEFQDMVNMAPAELEAWLDGLGPAPAAPGDGEGGSADRWCQRIVEIRRRSKHELTAADYDHMRAVVDRVRGLLARRPDGDVTGSAWRRELMRCGHDPLRET